MSTDWFLHFAPRAYRETRGQTTRAGRETREAAKNLTDVSVTLLKATPSILPTLRMSSCPPLAVARVVGPAGVSRNLINVLEKKGALPPRMPRGELDRNLEKIGALVEQMTDPDIFVWRGRNESPTKEEGDHAATTVADRLCGAVATRSSGMRRKSVSGPPSGPGS